MTRMPAQVARILFLGVVLFASFLPLFAADSPAPGPNSDPTYQQLRNLTLGGEAVSVSNFDLKRDAGTFPSALGNGVLCDASAGQGHGRSVYR